MHLKNVTEHASYASSDGSNLEEETPKVPEVRQRKFTLALICVTGFWGGCAFSLMAPFIPQEAKRKGMSSIQTGFIFSGYQIGLFVASPFMGNYLTRIGSKFVLSFGLVVCGLFTVLFGLTTRLPSGAVFFSVAVFCRIADAISTAGVITACYAIAANTYPDKMSLTFGLFETSMCVGLMAAPALGGVLYEVGGFWLPFFVTGASMILHAVILLLFLPPAHDVKKERKRSVCSLLSSTIVWVAILCIFNSAMGSMFMGPTLSLYLHNKFGLSASLIGLMFVVTPTTYGLLAPVWGYLADKKELYTLMIVMGNLFAGTGILLIGPSPILTFLPSTIGVIATGLAILGGFNNCGLIPTRKCLLIGAVNLGFENNLDTYGIVSGLFNSVYCLGAFVGPILSGAINQELGFPSSTTVFGSFFFLSAFSSGIYFTIYFLSRHFGSTSSRQAQYEILEEEVPATEQSNLHSSKSQALSDRK